MEKKQWWEDLWDYVWLFILLESLIVPWEPIKNHSPLLHRFTGDQILQNEESLSSKGLRKYRHKFIDYIPYWNQNFVVNTRLNAYVLDEIQLQPGPSTDWNLPSTYPSHPEPAWGLRRPRTNDVQHDLSLEDSDLIDVLWRADIDLEKGINTVIPTPENQHERDLQLLNEKQYAPQLNQYHFDDPKQAALFDSFSQAYNELWWAQEQYAKNYPSNNEREKNFWPDPELNRDVETLEPSPSIEEDTIPWKNSCQYNETQSPDFFQSLSAEDDWTSLKNDVCLSSVAINEEQNNLENGADTLISTVELEEVGEGDVGGGELNEMIPDGGLSLPPPLPLDNIQTPELELSTLEVNRIFRDRQVAQDVIASLPTPTSTTPSLLMDNTATQCNSVVADGSVSDQRVPDREYRQLINSEEDRESIMSDVMMESYTPLQLSNVDIQSFPFKQEPSPSLSTHSLTMSEHSSDLPSTSQASCSSVETQEERMGGVRGARMGVPQREESHEWRGIGKLVPKVTGFDDGISDEEESNDLMNDKNDKNARPGRQSQDEKLAKELGLKYTAEEIGAMPLSQFNRVLRTPGLTHEQKDVMQKIRRRGINC